MTPRYALDIQYKPALLPYDTSRPPYCPANNTCRSISDLLEPLLRQKLLNSWLVMPLDVHMPRHLANPDSICIHIQQLPDRIAERRRVPGDLPYDGLLPRVAVSGVVVDGEVVGWCS